MPRGREDVVEGHMVELIEVAPRPRPVVDLAEDGRVSRAPLVGQLLRIAVRAARAKRLRDPRAPVHKGPEDVEDQRLDSHLASVPAGRLEPTSRLEEY